LARRRAPRRGTPRPARRPHRSLPPRAPRRPSGSYHLAGAQSARAAGILGTLPRRCPRRQTGIREDAGAERQADEITRARKAGLQREQIRSARDAARRNILGGANVKRRSDAARRRLSAEPSRAVRRLSNLRTRSSPSGASIAPAEGLFGSLQSSLRPWFQS
jgi:hypothetical protein